MPSPPPPLPTASMSQAPGASRSGDDDALASRFAAQPTTPPDRRRGASTTTMSTSPWQPRDSIGTNEPSATADGAACDDTHGSPAALSLVELQMAVYHQGTAAAAALLGIPRPLSWTDGAPARFRTKSECRRALAAAIADVLEDSEVESLPTANGPGAAFGMSAPSASGGFPGSLWEPSRLFPTQ